MKNKKPIPKPKKPIPEESGLGVRTLTETQIHDVLRNERRHRTLKYLYRYGGEIDLRTLSERIAEDETGVEPAPRDVRESVYSSLHQTHLPKLDDLDIITYHRVSKKITLEDRAKSVMGYTGHSTVFGMTWIQCLAGIALMGFVVIGATSLVVPGISRVSIAVLAGVFLLLIATSILYRFRQRRNTRSTVFG